MRHQLKLPAIAGLTLSLLSLICWGDDAAKADLPTKTDSYRVSYDVNADGSHTETHAIATTVLKSSALEDVKQTSFSYSTSIQRGEVLEAYTQKRDGRRIDVPKQNYQVESNEGHDKALPVFSDWTTISVVFPDLEVGDKVVFSYRIVETEPMFPGHFSMTEGFSQYAQFDDVDVRITAPTSLKVQHAAFQMVEKPVVEKDGKRTWEWTYQNPVPLRWMPEEAGIFRSADYPNLLFSTFKSYADIAEAYGVRARPKAVPTPRIRALAAELTLGKTTQRDMAKALYEWVARNITYGGNCIGVGAVVPHDVDFILDNKMGDCKDHATLLQALLTAKGIGSTQVLINSGGQYDLPTVPVVSNVNHVINYIPSLDLYADSTAEDIPFGMLPFGDVQKPVLHVDHYRDGVVTPSMPHAANVQIMRTKIKMAPDGTASGDTDISVNGMFAVRVRSWLRDLSQSNEAEFVKKVLASGGLHGKGSLEKEDPSALESHYRYSAKFEVEDLIPTDDSGGMVIRPVFSSMAPIARFLGSAFTPISKRDTACSGGHSTEEYSIVLPPNLKVVSVPKNVDLKGTTLSYKSTYQLNGNVLSVVRVLDDKTPGNVCSPQQMEEYQKVAKLIVRDLKSQVLYQFATP